MLKSVTCRKLSDKTCKAGETDCVKAECPSKLSAENIKQFIQKIADDYDAQMIIDNLPVANLQSSYLCGEMYDSTDKNVKYAKADGFPVGCKSKDLKQFFINNHLTFKMKFHKNEATGKYSVVGAAVIPSSIQHTKDSCVEGQDLSKDLQKMAILATTEDIVWTYSVQWEQSDIRWASRWDAYLNIGNTDDKVHWFSIINSIMIVFFLTGMVAMIMLRALHKDIALYNMADQGEDPTDETGWKLVHGDVFRKPSASQLLSIVTGSGIQLIGMAIVTIVFATLGFVSPANRGALTSIMLLFFAFMGVFAGYGSLRLYKMFEGEYWKITSVLTALFFPGIVFVMFLTINFIIFVSSNSSLAVPFTSLLILVSIWVGISIPLVLLGGYFGYSQEVVVNPTKVHKIPRQIPSQVWYVSSPFSILMGGILPFGAVFIELYFIMSSIWLNKFYFVFGFLFVVFVILIVTCCEITIVLIYFQLCNADYRWWWRSFLTSASSSFYLFAYSGFYYFTKLSAISHVTMTMVYFGYMAIISFFFFVLTGTVGFFSCFWFIRIIYGSIKVD